MRDVLQDDVQIGAELLAMESFDARRGLYHAGLDGVGRGALVGGEGELAEEGGEMGGEVRVVCGDVLVEFDFGLRAGFYNDGAGFVGEDAVAGESQL